MPSEECRSRSPPRGLEQAIEVIGALMDEQAEVSFVEQYPFRFRHAIQPG